MLNYIHNNFEGDKMLDKFKIGHYTDEEKGTGCTVCIFAICANVVLDFNVVPFAVVQFCVYLCRHTANPLPKVKVVWALVKQNATALA